MMHTILGETADQERLLDKERNQMANVKIEGKRIHDVNRGNEIDRQKWNSDLEFIYKES